MPTCNFMSKDFQELGYNEFNPNLAEHSDTDNHQ